MLSFWTFYSSKILIMYHKNLSSTTVFNINDNKKCFLNSKSVYQIGLDQNIRLFEYSLGGLAFDFKFWDSNFNIYLLLLFFLNTWHPPWNCSQLVRLAEHLQQQQTVRQWKTFVLTYSMHIFHEKSSISYKRACRTSTFEIIKRAKDATCERTLCYHKTECDACVFFLSTVPRCEWKSWISVQ